MDARTNVAGRLLKKKKGLAGGLDTMNTHIDTHTHQNHKM